MLRQLPVRRWPIFALVAACSSPPAVDAPPAPDTAAPHADAGAGVDAAPEAGFVPVQTCRTDLKSQLALVGAPGLAAAIVKNGRLVCTAAAGLANIQEGRAVTADTLFLWASVSKTITATSVMQLVDAGKLKLDDDVNAYLPFKVHAPACPDAPITVRQLLTHSSSIVDDAAVLDALQVKGQDSPLALLDFVQGYLTTGGANYHATTNFHAGCPGTYYSYSNVGVTLLGALVQIVSGQPFDAYTKAHVFAPLGMNETAWKLAALDPTHIAMPYAGAVGAFVPFGQYGEADWPDGMMRTSVVQLARFLLMNIGLGELDGRRLLASATVTEMRRSQVPQLDPTQGLVWFYDTFGSNSTNVLGHDGSDDGAASNMFFDPATGAGVILVANADWSDDNDDSPAADALMDLLFAEAKAY
jgi:CubicO group peptidase (beta-lactamase class C family)